MYTIDDKNHDEYEDEYLENTFWDNNKGLIIKIIIIILCVIVLIWLFKALKTTRNTSNDASIHNANVLKVRLAAEDYFFIKNNKKDKTKVDLLTLKNEGLTDNIVDANNKVCGDKTTNAILSKDVDSYKITVKLSCSTNDKEETFYYHNNTLACLNCDGKTNMNGDVNIKEEENIEEIDGGNKDDTVVVPVNNDDNHEYSCDSWSDWTKTRVNDSSLKERSKTLVQGVKYGSVSKIVYGNWSEYTTTPIYPSSNIEVETMVVQEEVWSNTKTARDINASSNIRVLDTRIVNENNCKNGFIVDNTCYSNQVKVDNLTFSEYNSGNYKVQKEYCEGLKTLKDKSGRYVLTYVNCRYNEVLNKNSVNNSYLVYDYQELEKRDTIYYRYRMVSTVDENSDPVYTKDKYEEKYLPEGFVKVNGTEEVYYSYKYAVCEK